MNSVLDEKTEIVETVGLSYHSGLCSSQIYLSQYNGQEQVQGVTFYCSNNVDECKGSPHKVELKAADMNITLEWTHDQEVKLMKARRDRSGN